MVIPLTRKLSIVMSFVLIAICLPPFLRSNDVVIESESGQPEPG